MNTKKNLAHIAGTALLLAACGGGQQSGHVFDVSDTEKGVLEVNRFGLSLFEAIDERPCDCVDNSLVAPLSVATTLAMLTAGANGQTALEMTTALGFPANVEAMNHGLGNIATGLESVSGTTTQLLQANRVWAAQDVSVLTEYNHDLTNFYRSEVGIVDFQNAPDEATQSINGWVEKQTNGKIQNMLAPGTVDSSTAMVLTNAMYLNAEWEHPFATAQTTNATFLGSQGGAPVRMMRQTSNFLFAEVAGFKIIELGYAGDRLAMDIVLPREGTSLGAKNLQDLLSNLQALTAELRLKSVDVSIPAFAFSSGSSLTPELQKLGFKRAFTSDADFSKIAGGKNISLADVVHKTFITVTERGTEAGASTAAVMHYTSILDSAVFTADHPFMFLIRDKTTGINLFLGTYNGPEAP